MDTTDVIKLPRVAITYCTQCKWMLRAAYFGQELLSTFSTAIGEIALLPATGGTFNVKLTYAPQSPADGLRAETIDNSALGIRPHTVLIWDRKAEGGFPETKVLKQRIRDHIEPNRDLGHSDRHGKAKSRTADDISSTNKKKTTAGDTPPRKQVIRDNEGNNTCEDCR